MTRGSLFPPRWGPLRPRESSSRHSLTARAAAPRAVGTVHRAMAGVPPERVSPAPASPPGGVPAASPLPGSAPSGAHREARERPPRGSAASPERALADAPAAASDARELLETRERLAAAETKFRALRDDFHYNLRLLRERDALIDRLEPEVRRLRAVLEEGGPSDDDPAAIAAMYERTLRTREDEHARALAAARAEAAEATARCRAESARRDAAERAAKEAVAGAESVARRAARAEADADAAKEDAMAAERRAAERAEATARRQTAAEATEARAAVDYEAKCAALAASMREAEALFETERRRREAASAELASMRREVAEANAAEANAKAEAARAEAEAAEAKAALEAALEAANAEGGGTRPSLADAEAEARASSAPASRSPEGELEDARDELEATRVALEARGAECEALRATEADLRAALAAAESAAEVKHSETLASENARLATELASQSRACAVLKERLLELEDEVGSRIGSAERASRAASRRNALALVEAGEETKETEHAAGEEQNARDDERVDDDRLTDPETRWHAAGAAARLAASFSEKATSPRVDDDRLTDPETRWRAAGAAARLAASFQKPDADPGAEEIPEEIPLPTEEELARLRGVRDRLASLSRALDDQAARAETETGARSPILRSRPGSESREPPDAPPAGASGVSPTAPAPPLRRRLERFEAHLAEGGFGARGDDSRGVGASSPARLEGASSRTRKGNGRLFASKGGGARKPKKPTRRTRKKENPAGSTVLSSSRLEALAALARPRVRPGSPPREPPPRFRARPAPESTRARPFSGAREVGPYPPSVDDDASALERDTFPLSRRNPSAVVGKENDDALFRRREGRHSAGFAAFPATEIPGDDAFAFDWKAHSRGGGVFAFAREEAGGKKPSPEPAMSSEAAVFLVEQRLGEVRARRERLAARSRLF